MFLQKRSKHFTVCEFTDLSKDVHRKFFITWLGHMASIKDEFTFFPQDKDGHKYVVDEFRSIGFPGCIGSVDCVDVGWDKCPKLSSKERSCTLL